MTDLYLITAISGLLLGSSLTLMALCGWRAWRRYRHLRTLRLANLRAGTLLHIRRAQNRACGTILQKT